MQLLRTFFELGCFGTLLRQVVHAGHSPLAARSRDQHRLSRTIARRAADPSASLAPNGRTPPHTGVVRSYHLNVTRGFVAPDGVNRTAVLINGQFPAPTIEVNWGDILSVEVYNGITDPEDGTSIHWHGFLQQNTQWADGVPSITQCPIAPGKSMTYKFIAEMYGTTWYHSHYGGQSADGALGALIINGPKDVPYDIDLGPVILTDWYHTAYPEYIKSVVGLPHGAAHMSDSNLINGKGQYNCSLLNDTAQTCSTSGPMPAFNFTNGKTHRIRLINAGTEGIQRFTIDDHVMTVIANDFVPVKPYNASVITLAPGQRSDILVYAHGLLDSSVWMRADLSPHCALPNNPYAVSPIYYPRADRSTLPQSLPTQYNDSYCGNDELTLSEPFFAESIDPIPATTQDVNITFGQNATGNYVWFMNNASFRADYSASNLASAATGNYSFLQHPPGLTINTGNNASIRLIVRNTNYKPHPMHLHGHSFSVLAQGVGEWDGRIIRGENPQRRDTQIIQGASGVNGSSPGFLVLQYKADNPGIWPFHCHVLWHSGAGFSINIMEQVDRIKKLHPPAQVKDTCHSWAAWTNRHVVDEIDAGI